VEITFDKIAIAGGADSTPEGVRPPSGPMGLTIQGSRSVQVDEFIRGEWPSFKDRNNKATTISFSVERQHRSYGAAEIFCLTHAEDLPTIGDLVIKGRTESGAPLQRIAKNAALVDVRSSHKGVSSTHTYQFMMGELQKAKVTT
jgi:hypothetical protein